MKWTLFISLDTKDRDSMKTIEAFFTNLKQLYMINRSYEDLFKAWEIVDSSPAKQFLWIPAELDGLKGILMQLVFVTLMEFCCKCIQRLKPLVTPYGLKLELRG